MAVQQTKGPYNTYQNFPFQDNPKFTQNIDFGLNINHLASLSLTQFNPLVKLLQLPQLGPALDEKEVVLLNGLDGRVVEVVATGRSEEELRPVMI
jgi:hypothetical protein